MDKSNCSICDNEFDGTTLCPRTLPCGHSFCTQCIQSGINKGNGVCLTCSVEHGVNCATDLPICYLFEEFSHMIPTTNSQTHELDSSKEDGDKVMCTKHKEMPLHLFCKSHGAKTCHTCAVIEHSTTSCLLISLENNIKEKKQSQIAYLHKQKQAIMDNRI
ncbi:unnamed protein product [Meganyctiphanes norvegica]|uniref:RING-type domain-containing protein n=1 Tax=Meganyctiphanes norvegica TaxID=48144 RepID=A0AAV2R2K9_MEGNR